MNTQPASDFITVADYIKHEEGGELRHEYINGIIHAMGGASANHNLISLNIASILRKATRPTPCQVFIADMKVALNIGGEEIFYYPDLLVSCDPQDNDPYFRKHPCLVVEVLSPTTERIDRREKFLAYTTLNSLKEYILVSQEEQVVTLFRRKNEWKPEIFRNPAQFDLDCLNCILTLEEIYEDIDLAVRAKNSSANLLVLRKETK
ncbi:MAG: Uma2 family endonuclease [Bacteroidales bacterium]|jgi:Uma2 family endonuclease|nr:Uma2 family endonuclease [Bacteroidales bacterium]